MKSRTAAILLGVTALGAWLRLQSLGSKSLWYNEADSSCFLELTPTEVLARSFEPQAVHPPLYHLILHAWSWAWGGSDGSLRSLAAACGVATILGVYALARELSIQSGEDDAAAGRAPSVACLAALLVAMSPLQVQLSRQVRGYSMAAMLLAWGGWALVRATRAGGRPAPGPLWPLASLLALLACYTHHMATLTVAALVFYAVARWPEIRDGGGVRPTKSILLAASILAAGYLAAGLPALLAQGQTVRRDYSDPFGLGQAACEVAMALSSTALSDPRDGGMGAWFAGGLAVVGMCVAFRASRRGWHPGLYLALTGMLPLIVQVGFSVASDRSVVKARYLAFAQLSWLVAIAFSTRIARGPAARWALAGWIVAAFAHSCRDSWPVLGPAAEPGMRAVVAKALEGRSPGELIISADPTAFCGVRHYTRGSASPLLLVEEASRTAQRGSEHLLDGQLTTLDGLEAASPTGLWVISTVAHQFGRDDLIGRVPGIRPVGRWIFKQDYHAEPPLILAHYRIDPAPGKGPGAGAPAPRPDSDRAGVPIEEGTRQ
jgi:hypothetical protein